MDAAINEIITEMHQVLDLAKDHFATKPNCTRRDLCDFIIAEINKELIQATFYFYGERDILVLSANVTMIRRADTLIDMCKRLVPQHKPSFHKVYRVFVTFKDSKYPPITFEP